MHVKFIWSNEDKEDMGWLFELREMDHVDDYNGDIIRIREISGSFSHNSDPNALLKAMTTPLDILINSAMGFLPELREEVNVVFTVEYNQDTNSVLFDIGRKMWEDNK